MNILGYFDWKPWRIYCTENQKLVASYRFRNEAESHALLLNGMLLNPKFVVVYEGDYALTA